jgi:predicted membrane protein
MKNKAANGLKSGYEAGKAMTKQGVQNVKDSLKSGFSAKNILVTAGITVATDLATQIMRGEDPSLKKAIKTVACAEFAGSVVGSVTGAAAGSFFTPFLSAIPVVGGVLSALAPTFGAVIGSSVGSYLAGDIKNGRFSIKNAFKNIDWAGVVGQSIGSTAGAALGSCLGPVGTIIGGIVGGYAGNWVAQKLKNWFGGRDSSYSSIGMPVGTTTMGSVVASNVSIGSVAGNTTTEIPVAMSSEVPVSEVAVSSSADTMGTYSSEIQLAEAKYQELYKLYNEMLSSGRQDDALKVAVEMNKAKADYESLKASHK